MRDFCAKCSDESGRRTRATRALPLTALFTASGWVLFPTSEAMAGPLAPAQFDHLAASCAPGVASDVLRAVASKESHFDPLALHDNTRKITRMSADAKAAAALAQSWIASGDSVDIGLMQINAPNLPRLGLTVTQALDPCLSLAAGAAVLRDAYHQGASQAEQQAALLIMLSRYNTGRPLAGLVNGYVGDVIGAAPPAAPARNQMVAQSEPAVSTVPDWDVWANASFAQAHGAAWLVDLSEPASPSSKTVNSAGTLIHNSQ
jgi:type IV secretion system protein VirB1